MTRLSTWWLICLALVGVLLVAALWWVGRGPDGRPGRVPVVPVVPPRVVSAEQGTAPAADLLRAWDRRRARAYADADAVELGALYLPGSRAAAADVRLLRRYRSRGLHVVDMRMQVFSVLVLAHTPGLWRLRVTDRLDRAVAVGRGTRVDLPRDRASTHVVVIRRSTAGRWRVVSVT